MKFSVQSVPLLKQLQAVSKIINSKNARAILDNFLLRIEGNTLYITGSDSENMLTASIEVEEPDGDGSIAVGAKTLIDYLKTVPPQGVTFYVNDETQEVELRYMSGHFNFVGTNAAEYPLIAPVSDEAHVINMATDVVQRAIDCTLFAVSQDTIRPVMTGIYWDFHENDITFVSSDTHKLVRYVNTSVAPGEEFSFILPAKPAAIMQSIFSKEPTNLIIKATQQNATFKFENYELTCLFIKGNYPNYGRVIPKENPFELTIDRVSFLNATRRAALSASLASSLVKINIQPDEILLSSQDIDYAKSYEERLMCQYSGNSMTIGFNATYLMEVLSNLDAETAVLKLSDPARPGIFVPQEQGENEDVLMLLMPMQVID